jgi:hypothetical protein
MKKTFLAICMVAMGFLAVSCYDDSRLWTEVESLGELKTVKPDEFSTHIESWSLCKKNIDVDFRNDDSIDNLLKSILIFK